MLNFAPKKISFQREYKLNLTDGKITIVGTRAKAENLTISQDDLFTVSGNLRVEIVYHKNEDELQQEPLLLEEKFPLSLKFEINHPFDDLSQLQVALESSPKIINYRIEHSKDNQLFLVINVVGTILVKIKSLFPADDDLFKTKPEINTKNNQDSLSLNNVKKINDQDNEKQIKDLKNHIANLSEEITSLKKQLNDISTENDQVNSLSRLAKEIQTAKNDFLQIKNEISYYQKSITNSNFIGNITGTIKDHISLKPLPQVIIEVSPVGVEDIVSKSASDENGRYEIKILPGHYQLRLRKTRFLPTRVTGLTIYPGEAKKQDISMKHV